MSTSLVKLSANAEFKLALSVSCVEDVNSQTFSPSFGSYIILPVFSSPREETIMSSVARDLDGMV